jgi:hypothetical protein
MRLWGLLVMPVFLALIASSNGAEKQWTTIKGKVVLDAKIDIPKMAEIVPNADKEACLAKGKFFEEMLIVDPKTRAIKNVLVWIEPADSPKRKSPFPQELIHETLRKPEKKEAVVDQPCCQFVPHIVTARVGQTLVIKNSAPVAHNAKYDSEHNGQANPLIPSKGKEIVQDLKLEDMPFTLSCSIHTNMSARVAIFDHPYFAVTDDKGEFEIKLAPQGKFKLFVWQEEMGWKGGRDGGKGGTPITITGETLDLKEIIHKK